MIPAISSLKIQNKTETASKVIGNIPIFITLERKSAELHKFRKKEWQLILKYQKYMYFCIHFLEMPRWRNW